MTIVGMILAYCGVALLVISALGLFLLPDALSRQHAATKSATLSLGLLLTGIGLQVGDAGWWLRIGLLLALLLLTLPVAAHMLARAAARTAYTDQEKQNALRPEESTRTDSGSNESG